jgi:hypothetical protein
VARRRAQTHRATQADVSVVQQVGGDGLVSLGRQGAGGPAAPRPEFQHAAATAGRQHGLEPVQQGARPRSLRQVDEVFRRQSVGTARLDDALPRTLLGLHEGQHFGGNGLHDAVGHGIVAVEERAQPVRRVR